LSIGLPTAAKPALERVPEMGTRAHSLVWYFVFFFLSGLCSLLYELIWLRLAMAQFGVTTAMVSIVLSTFMGGLGAGSWAAGRLLRKYSGKLNSPPLHLYAVCEMLIGCSAVVVPLELLLGRYVLEHIGGWLQLSSGAYYVAAGIWLAITLVPWCACMGATIPLAMFAIRSERPSESQRSFSFLYLANVLGALTGTFVPLVLVEYWGFNGALRFGLVLNLAICAMAFRLAKNRSQPAGVELGASGSGSLELRQMAGSGTLWLLFLTGLTSMGMEVVWTRLYTIYVGTLVYSFALILGAYLAATFLGSMIYRWLSSRQRGDGGLIWLALWLAALAPLLTADMRASFNGWLRVPLGIAGFSGLLGFLTPKLVDRFSEGDPDRAGAAYAVNVLGCILGPLVAGFGLLPYLDERYALLLLAAPWLVVGVMFTFARQTRLSGGVKIPTLSPTTRQGWGTHLVILPAILIASVLLIVRTRSYLQTIPNAQVRRDSTATVVAAGEGMDKELYVNGISMTALTPITKMMSAMPLTFLDHAPQSALVICFGMGTTHRSMLSWGIDSTAVDLVPSVPKFFSYFHADADELVKSPQSHIVVDDGRRFLERTTSQYDVIVIDPPPPIGAAGSSLLYSREFYTAAKRRLRPGGILMQWYPGGDRRTTASISLALKKSFHYVRAFASFEDWGVHYMASQSPIPQRTPVELASRMPANAAADLTEWGPYNTPEGQFAAVLKREVPIDALIDFDSSAPALEDDRPVNEYGLMRNLQSFEEFLKQTLEE